MGAVKSDTSQRTLFPKKDWSEVGERLREREKGRKEEEEEERKAREETREILWDGQGLSVPAALGLNSPSTRDTVTIPDKCPS